MISASTGSFVLEILSVLASGYIIYDAPICRLWWRRHTDYALYLSTITTGLILVTLLAGLLYALILLDVSLGDFAFKIENLKDAPILALLVALGLRALVKVVVLIRGKCQPQWKVKLKIKTLNERRLDQFIYERVVNKKMIMVTLENQKVYAGWPIEVPDNEDWLRLAPQWSGYRDEYFMITARTDYSKVFDTSARLLANQMLIPVGKIATVQPFDEEVFQKFQL